ncbi:sigma-70 family RNA polymerase sigma factor [Pseudolysobacter antarcticus]|uniref:Sigma-70 family RNA polymerase sigma factor n=1 Tax=Pseudolysobacter antarcticus TaxID=2511995 RepID=A0A411HGA0_9GAMM|nr:ECF-type sigma factor [Pseudolysobacter antarcticus]QBB69546.1 sigma-70 family RNA polymerase sigma factor [Pseudolysobacter antarcticus]
MTGESAITELLNAANSGDIAAQDVVYTTLYDELKRCAQRLKHTAPGSSLTSTALVHELFLRLNQRCVVKIQNRAHFFALAARAMRQIIVDHARRHRSIKRGGGAEFTDAEKGLNMGADSAEQALELDAALTRLASRDADLARVVEWHFFAGLSFKEIGVALGRHERTVQHDWTLARALLQESMLAAPGG